MLMHHYTDITALTNIVSKNELWLTHTDYLNDYTEGKELYNMLCGILKSEPNIIKLIDYVDSLHEAYCLSFSMEQNLLSQWRGYCPSEGGYNLGVENNVFQLPFEVIDDGNKSVSYPDNSLHVEKLLEGTLLNFSIGNHDCIYQEEDKISFAKDLAGILTKAYKDLFSRDSELILKYCDSGYSSLDKDEQTDLYNSLKSNTSWYHNYTSGKYQFKNHAFKEESEIRMIVCGEKGHVKPFYRAKKNILIPYLKMKFDTKFIKGIMIGPCENQVLAHLGIKHFLGSNNYYDKDGLHSFVSLSDTPYRNV